MENIIYIATHELSAQNYRYDLWKASREMPYSRRVWWDVLSQRIYSFTGKILIPDGRHWPVPDIDDVMGDPRWLSYYFEEYNGRPRREVRLIERLRILDLWFRISKPHIQAGFGMSSG